MFRAYFANLTSFGTAAQDGWLSSVGYAQDTEFNYNETVEYSTTNNVRMRSTNKGFEKRMLWFMTKSENVIDSMYNG